MKLLHNIGVLLTMPTDTGVGALQDAAVLFGDTIEWLGPNNACPDVGTDVEMLDAQGALVTPGLIDPHTHVVYSGERSREFEMRSNGRTYSEISAAGGGILSTVNATRDASLEALCEASGRRLANMTTFGVTTAEAKSGYGLDLATELKLLRAIRQLSGDVELIPTFLGAHAVPPEHRAQPNGKQEYLRHVIHEILPAVASEHLAVFCDIFVEEGFFSVEDGRDMMRAAAEVGLAPKLHVDQLGSGGGAELAAEVGAVSADHLDHASDDSLAALASAGTVAVLLPGAAIYLGESPPSARRFIDAGVRVALATDCNPGTCPTEDLPLMMTLGCSLLGMTVDEVWLATTRHAASAVARTDIGRLSVGAQSDLVVWDAESPAAVPYRFGTACARQVYKRGREVFTSR